MLYSLTKYRRYFLKGNFGKWSLRIEYFGSVFTSLKLI